MLFKILLLLLNGLLPILPALFVVKAHAELTAVTPWPIVGTLLAVHVLFIATAWKHIGYTRRRRETEALMMLVNSFVPLATYHWILSADMPLSYSMQIVIYCSGQVIWLVSIGIAPDWVGRFRQPRAEEKALSGRQRFESREAV